MGNFIRVRLALLLGLAACGGAVAAPVQCVRTVTAEVVALDQVMMINRLGASRPGGMIYALRSDTVADKDGHVQLRDGKRPRPLVLRVNAGDCLDIVFQNLLLELDAKGLPPDHLRPDTRAASIHVAGLQLVERAADAGMNAGISSPGGAVDGPDGCSSYHPKVRSDAGNGVVPPGGCITYHLYAPEEGSFLLYSTAGDFNGFGADQLTMGLFGAVNVQPRDAEWYRSQVTQEDLQLATRGKAPDGHPIIDYDAVYPPAHERAGTPILRMLNSGNRIVHSDLTAVITGPRHGRFGTAVPVRQPNPALPDQAAPYREITVLYHESQDVVQAFPWFYVPENKNTPSLNAGADTFAINYGAAGIGAEILANRLGLGPGANCQECKFEEFFLSSWVGGDPAMVVDRPANRPCTMEELEAYSASTADKTPRCTPARGAAATKAYFPDDPSNVYHTYQGDRARFRILHAGASVHHVHHHHAHQWLQTSGSDKSAYLDSQAIGPGAAYTLDLVYDGSGNRNLTAGDSIFHCHFYPHFASGMWALFRVHDVLETGTALDQDGRPRAGARALPDAEIMAGTPIPAVVPLPTRPMAPLPSAVSIKQGKAQLTAGGSNPGYPFFVPGLPGHRPPHPPMDFAVDGKEVLDGGLPRHLITHAVVKPNEQHTSTDFTKDLDATDAYELPEQGTLTERIAMAAHAQQSIPSFLPDGSPGRFKMTGLPPAQGAPFANPGMGIDGKVRRYKGANLQVNAVFNKKGWHYPQQRMMALWEDVQPILNGEKPPEPLFFRAHSGDVVEYWHTNLIPDYYELDDFQVRTPTDIIGQHIHLVKFDVLASDGAANGFNYEDGSFSPNEVQARIDGINKAGGLKSFDGTRAPRMLKAKPIAAFGDGPVKGSKQWLGAQATVQRWWIDPLLDRSGTDRTYMTVFTHDHFGPSTHQMAGLYGGLLIEPAGSRWTMPDGRPLHTRADGGPTSYAANILPAGAQRPYREFALAWSDLQLAYNQYSRSQPDCYPGQAPRTHGCKALATGASYQGWADPPHALNCPACGPGTLAGKPSPFLISDFGAGIMSMNYRGEPLPLRLAGAGNAGEGADLAHVFRSIPRLDPQMSTQPKGGAPLDPACVGECLRFPLRPIGAGMLPADPYTPLLRAYEGDQVQLRLLVGAHTSMHDFTLHGLKWQHAPADPDSGFRNSQFMVLSEHFEALFAMPRTASGGRADYLYNVSAGYEGLTNGLWGIVRGYQQPTPGLAPLPRQDGPPAGPLATSVPPGRSSDCSRMAPCLREFHVSALTITQLTGKDGLEYNARGAYVGPNKYDSANPLNDPGAIVYVQDEDLDANGHLKPGLVPEPLVLRAAAGDWIRVRLTNRMAGTETVFSQFESAARPGNGAPYSNAYARIGLLPSASVGLHPQLLAFDVSVANGVNLGINPVQTVAPGDKPCAASGSPCRDYLWYAGTLERGADGKLVETPVEFGAVNLQPADPLLHAYHGLFGALVVEPFGSSWVEDPGTRTSATVFGADGDIFRDFTLVTQNDTAMSLNGNSLYASGNGLSAFNYRSEPFFYRYGARANPGFAANPPRDWSALSAADLANIAGISFSGFDTKDAVSNRLVGGDPVTPIFRAPAGMPVRFRLLHAPGLADNQQVFELSGHQWQEEPYADGSRRIGYNPASAFTGTTSGFGPTSHFDVVIKEAGGRFRVPGDYLYRSATAAQYQVGLWGLFRVAPAGKDGTFPDTVAMTAVALAGGGYTVSGSTTVLPAAQASDRVYARTVALSSGNRTLAEVKVDTDGKWTYTGSGDLPDSLRAVSWFGGEATYTSTQEPPVAPAGRRLQVKRAPLLLRGSAPQ